MSNIVNEHRATAPQHVRCAVLTVSDTRTLANDSGGSTIVELLEGAGHKLAGREIVADEPAQIAGKLTAFRDRDDVDAILLTGGTGISSRDQTFETVTASLTKSLPGYGELVRMLSYAEIGSAAMMSRAVGGLMGTTVVLTMPGSPAAVRLVMNRVILPELSHLVREARR